ncbi:MAG TPA: NUDIX hydrolase [Thermoanaerobaculia bacterium]|nr:NUDIX hydrolase [Thermoanaerobaculia bacterium]
MKKLTESKRLLVLENDGWEYVERKKATEAVVVLAQDDDGKVILTEQLRRPVNARVIDFPAGLVGDEEGHDDPATTARKELEEETGYTCERVELLSKGPTSPGITSEIVSFYQAHEVRKKGKGGGVGGESITVHTIPLSDVVSWAREREQEGKLIDVKFWAGLYFLTR